MGQRMRGYLLAVRRCRLAYTCLIKSQQIIHRITPVTQALVPIPTHTATTLLVVILVATSQFSMGKCCAQSELARGRMH